MNARSASPFTPRTVLGLLLFGALAFVLTLYFIGIDETGANTNNGGGHGAGKGLNGFAALMKLAELNGVEMPITESLNQVLHGGQSPRSVVLELMTRSKKHEHETEEVAFPSSLNNRG